jgi:hypothetical protein
MSGRVSAQTAPRNFIMDCHVPKNQGTTVQPDVKLPDALPNCPDVRAIKNIKVAIHFFLKTKSSNETISDPCNASVTNPNPTMTYYGLGNFTEVDDGNGSAMTNGYLRAEEIIKYANDELDKNATQWRKTPNVIYPATPPIVPLRYFLVGTFFHRDDEVYSKTYPFDLNTVHAKYDNGKDAVLDIYYTPKHSDGGGEAGFLGGKNKFVFIGDYFTYVRGCQKDWSIKFSGSLLNHEIGHMYGLYHTWNETVCSDTPLGVNFDPLDQNPCKKSDYANCWSLDASKVGCPKPCDDWSKISNNIMDYNANAPHAFTKCQTEIVNADAITNGQTYIESCKGCVPANAFFTVDKIYKICEFKNKIMFDGQGSFNEDVYEISICEVTAKDPDKCLFSTLFTTGIVKGQVPKFDLSTIYKFLPNKFYKVTLTVSKNGCTPSSTTSEIIQTLGCTPPLIDCCDVIFAIKNPFSNDIFIRYDAKGDIKINQIQLVQSLTGATFNLGESIDIHQGFDELNFDTSELPSGMYTLIIKYNEQYSFKSVVKIN